MSWFKVDDKLHDNKKVRLAGVEAMGLWTLAGSWSAGDDTSDGFIPESVCARWAKNYRTLASKLVAAGFWHAGEHDGEAGWWFHDWLDFQIPAEETRRKKEEARIRMANVRKRRADRSREQPANETRTDPERSQDVRSTPTRPVPTRPVSTSVGTESGGSVELPNSPPPPCSKHPHGTTEPCGECGAAKRARAEWDTQQAQNAKSRQAEQRRTDNALRLEDVRHCQLCDDNGYRILANNEMGGLCDHRAKPTASERRAQIDAITHTEKAS